MENCNPIEIQTPFMSVYLFIFTSVLIRVLSGASTITKASTVSATVYIRLYISIGTATCMPYVQGHRI